MKEVSVLHCPETLNSINLKVQTQQQQKEMSPHSITEIISTVLMKYFLNAKSISGNEISSEISHT